MYMQRVTIRSFEKGLLFKDREFQKILEPGRHCVFRSKPATNSVSIRPGIPVESGH